MKRATKAHAFTLTTEQRAAVRAYAAENGRSWKEKLCGDWLRSAARVNGQHSPILQGLRNTAGPSWLNVVTLADLENS